MRSRSWPTCSSGPSDHAVRPRGRTDRPLGPADPRVAVRVGGGGGAGRLVRGAGRAVAGAAARGRGRWRPLPGGLGRVLGSRRWRSSAGRSASRCSASSSTPACAGTQSPAANFAPTFVFVIFWVGLVPASVLFGDVFRAFNPWRAIGRAVGWTARRVAAGRAARAAGLPGAPRATGRPPSAIFAFATLELVRSGGDQPDTVAIATLVYSALTFIAMALYGVEAVVRPRRGVLRLLQPVLAHLGVRDARPRGRACGRCSSGLAHLKAGRGHRRAAGGDDRHGHLRRRGRGADLDRHLARPDQASSETSASAPQPALELTFLHRADARAILLVLGFYRLGVLGARRASAAASTPSGWRARSSTRWCRSRSPT